MKLLNEICGEVKRKVKQRNVQVALLAALGITLAFVSQDILAATFSGGQDLKQISSNIKGGIQGTSSALGAIGYMCAAFLFLSAIFKFVQHGKNPDQHGIMLPVILFVGSLFLVFMPTLFDSGGKTLFGGSAVSQGADGTGFAPGI